MDELEKKDKYIEKLVEFIEKIYTDLSEIKEYMDNELNVVK